MNQNGAFIERGIVAEVTEAGYRVESYTRDGLITPAIPAAPGTVYSTGSRVYYFMFDDGNGMIIGVF